MEKTYSNYRWVIMVLGAIGSLLQTTVFMAPAVFIPMMMKEMNISIAQGGIIVTIILLTAGLTAPLGGAVMNKIGIKNTRTLSFLLFSIGGLVAFVSDSYFVLMLGRLVIGVGMGIGISTGNAITMDWFPEKERPMINAINSILSLLGSFLALSLAASLLNHLGTWQNTLGLFGILMLLSALLWIVLGQDNEKHGSNQGLTETPNDSSGILMRAFKIREIKLFILAYAAFMLANQSFNALLPTFYQTVRGMDAGASGNLTGFISLSAVFAGILSGVLMTVTGKRKIFMWPLLIILVLGCLGAISFKGGVMLYLSVIFIGICLDGWLPPMFTTIMELDGMTPKLAGTAQGLILSVGMVAGAISTYLIGWLSQYFGLQSVMFVFGLIPLIAVIVTLLVPETGPSRNKTTEIPTDSILETKV